MEKIPPVDQELIPLLIGWIEEHPKYGPLDEALKHRGLNHPIIRLYDGLIELSNQENKPQASYIEPTFFDKISELIEKHISECLICQDLVI